MNLVRQLSMQNSPPYLQLSVQAVVCTLICLYTKIRNG